MLSHMGLCNRQTSLDRGLKTDAGWHGPRRGSTDIPGTGGKLRGAGSHPSLPPHLRTEPDPPHPAKPLPHRPLHPLGHAGSGGASSWESLLSALGNDCKLLCPSSPRPDLCEISPKGASQAQRARGSGRESMSVQATCPQRQPFGKALILQQGDPLGTLGEGPVDHWAPPAPLPRFSPERPGFYQLRPRNTAKQRLSRGQRAGPLPDSHRGVGLEESEEGSASPARESRGEGARVGVGAGRTPGLPGTHQPPVGVEHEGGAAPCGGDNSDSLMATPRGQEPRTRVSRATGPDSGARRPRAD